MKLVVAEKPSVAKEIAYVIGADNKNTGYFDGNGYIVSYAVGHLLQLAEAGAYNEQYKAWSISDLPILPDTFRLTVSESTKAQYNVLKRLFLRDDVDEIICATDAGREGELIFRLIYNHIGCNKPCKRLWISSLTEDSILKGFHSLKDIKEYNNLYVSAFARAKADWIFGINFTRLFSLKYNNKLTVGRVQTPTLHLIVKRDYEIENFVKEKYFTLKLDNGAAWFNKDSDTDCIKTKDEAERIKAKCTGKNAVVSEVKKEKKTENRPLLYSLTSLQQDANKKLGFSAQKTLDIVQKLYEAKLTTYPRTDSSYLSDDMKDDVIATVNTLAGFYKPDMVKPIISEGLNLDSRIFNDDKVTDHHAIIPTKDIAKMEGLTLTKDERAVLELIIDRFVIILSVPHIYNVLTFTFDVDGELFKASSKEILQDGFKRFVKPDKESAKEDAPESFIEGFSYKKGDIFKVSSVSIVERFTKPKERFTEATLLSVMENIDRVMEDDELKQFVKERGLGTPATRAGIIEKLIQVGYIERKGKQLISTSLGRKFIGAVPEAVKDIEMTAAWEQTLLDIEKGLASESDLLDDVIRNVTVVVALESDKEGERIAMDKVVVGVCPRCGKNVCENDKAFSCEGYKDDPKCSFSIWKNDKFFSVRGKTVSKDLAGKLLKGGKVLVKGFKKKDGSGSYDAYVSLQDTGTYVNFSLEFPSADKAAIGVCPRCGKNVYENNKAFSCEGYKDDSKCSFAIWKNDKFFSGRGKTVSKDLAGKLLKGDKVLVKGFKKKDGSGSYDAYVSLQDTGMYVNFHIVEYANQNK